MRSLAVLMTCHNRVNSTLECLKCLFSQSVGDQLSLKVYLVDDGSSDGTGEVVQKYYPGIQVIRGNGDLFWNRGMHKAFGEALKTGFDYYLWLNDDTYLYRDSLETLLSTHEEIKAQAKAPSVVVASTRDPDTMEFTYGGYRKRIGIINPVGFNSIIPGNRPIRCDTMCGNCVLIPNAVADIVGNLDSIYRHRWGDMDYGLRALKKGCQIWVAPGYLADCQANHSVDKWKNRRLPLKERLSELHSVKGLEKGDWLRFVRHHGGVLWPLVWISPYVRLLIGGFK